MEARRIIARLICVISICMTISSCEKESSNIIGKWQVTDYQPIDGIDGPAVPKDDKTEEEFMNWAGGVIEFLPKGVVRFFNCDYNYSVKDGVVTITDKQLLPDHLVPTFIHLRIECDTLFLYDDIGVPGYDDLSTDIFLGLIFERFRQ